MDAWLRRLYNSHPVRYLLFTLGIAVLETTVLAVVHDVYFGSRIYDQGWRGFAIVGAVGGGGAALAGVFTALRCRAALADLIRWARATPRNEDLALAVSQSVPALARRFTLGFAVIAVFTAILPGESILLLLAHRFTLADILVTLTAGLAPVVYTAVFVWFWLEFMLRRVAADAARWLPPMTEHAPQAGLGVAGKLILGLSAATVGSAEFVVALSQPRGSRLHGMESIVGLTTVAAVPYLITISLAVGLMVLGPVLELIRATKAVGQGNYGVSLPVTTEDEFAVLSTTFNAMVDGLRERERLRGDNEELVRELKASRARIVEAADAERRRIERNIHDGAQQQLVAVTLDLRMLRDARSTMHPEQLDHALDEAADHLRAALAELRELARGLHPSILTTDGLGAALKQLRDRSPVPVSVEAPGERFPEHVETAAYFVAAEALANVAKYAHASAVNIRVSAVDHSLSVSVSDDGIGGADLSKGSGLLGLSDRIRAVGGDLRIDSASGRGTEIRALIPLQVA